MFPDISSRSMLVGPPKERCKKKRNKQLQALLASRLEKVKTSVKGDGGCYQEKKRILFERKGHVGIQYYVSR
jgi:hypothetical protein